jgi:predicted DNA-binding transcriptional regulator YafY
MKQPNNRSTLARILAIASRLTDRRGVRTSQLIAELEVSPKTIARDRDFIRDRLGIDLVFDRERMRWKATNVEEVLPVVKTLSRFL